MRPEVAGVSLNVVAASSVAGRRRQWVDALHRVATVHEAGDRSSLAHKLRGVKPTILLLDLVLSDGDGRSTLAELQKVSPETKVIVLTSTPSETEGTAMLESGAKGYCSADIDGPLLVKAI